MHGLESAKIRLWFVSNISVNDFKSRIYSGNILLNLVKSICEWSLYSNSETAFDMLSMALHIPQEYLATKWLTKDTPCPLCESHTKGYHYWMEFSRQMMKYAMRGALPAAIVFPLQWLDHLSNNSVQIAITKSEDVSCRLANWTWFRQNEFLL